MGNLTKMARCAVFCVVLVFSSFTWSNARNFPSEDRGGDRGKNYRYGNTIYYEWIHTDYYGNEYQFEFQLHLGTDYQIMQNRYSKLKHEHGNYGNFVRDDPYKGTLICIARQIRSFAKGYGLNECELALSFVQSLPYQEMGSYQRYSVEALIDGKGDCSDTSVLLAGIFVAWGYDCIFLGFPNHLAVGIWSKGYFGCYWKYNNREFYYCETTGYGFNIGACLDDIGSTKAELYDI